MLIMKNTEKAMFGKTLSDYCKHCYVVNKNCHGKLYHWIITISEFTALSSSEHKLQ